MAHSHDDSRHDDSRHDHSGHGHSGHSHGSTDKKRVLIAACLTAGFMVAEALGGLFTGSLALLADAGHMLADAIALGLAWYAFHLADRPATVRLTYGFGRVKTLVAYTNGIAIFVIALWIVYEAWERLQTPAPVLGGPMLVVAILGLLVNIGSFLVLHGGDRESLNMRGAILHVLGDLLGSAAAIVAAIVILATGWTPIDPILSVLVSLLILSTAWSLMRAAAHVLLEGVPPSLDRDLIASDIATTVQGVREVHHMHIWSIDGTSSMATLHACLNEGVDAHKAVSAIKKRLASEHGISHATVEPEFGQCADDGDEHDHGHDHDHHQGHDAALHHGHHH
ncbi:MULTISPECIES: cation diffusion facilitator family transporter [unclassified Mesorhizobium]|uniref:cation diffusion facilitator family transporter n=1 Tax=unclassified Mesorhizobium TaxID=325217 RepID=UPI001129B056|nr:MULTISPECIES: cation diffusion facilitator family transporter [unclassified Mesorhizobium]TPJ47338.1 cation transporter [Mesorhizobium sp. B2-6-6]MBZ9999744.1 cation diffusion facilitator family transporter [Mesorhizobium sp. B264B2A]MCA0005538.1 cation diffusion facilitator family transporter [Mesorhizobium sp. B264B1B]MCA0019950.1 cation diffusion facilitator family transporter [Mesorhizobium sp. B264B1A]TPJ53358.1 cation transporter [Mesorhizobium sp. B2-6-4]